MAENCEELGFLLLLCTCPSQEIAENLAKQVVSNSLAGCVNILPNLLSVYQWQGKIEQQQEYLLLIKTHRDSYSSLEQLLKNKHPYQVPEIITIPINNGSSEYLAWLKQCLK
jgi:periplasmic divalent cation tolerance protein